MLYHYFLNNGIAIKFNDDKFNINNDVNNDNNNDDKIKSDDIYAIINICPNYDTNIDKKGY